MKNIPRQKMMSQNNEHNADRTGDLVLGLTLIGLSLFVIIESLRMPLQGTSGFLMSPGFAPLLAGGILLCLSIGLTVGAFLTGSHRQLGLWSHRCVTNSDNKRFLVLAAIMGLYIFGLVGRIHFAAATLVFHALIFTYLRIGHALKIAVAAVLATFLVAFLLPKLFQIPLP